jgi:tetratricopeptide (TPR) repeat protein
LDVAPIPINFPRRMATKSPPAPKPRKPARRGIFVAAFLILPLLALIAAELILRAFGWGGFPARIREAGKLPSGATVCFVEPDAARPYLSPGTAATTLAERQTFLMPKPKDTVRIFLVGESAAKGDPQPRNLAVSAFLQAMLSDAWPEKKVEVVNLGTSAVASFPLVYQVRDAIKFSPDLFIFYAGNNEFFGAYGAASFGGRVPPEWGQRWMRAVRGLALVQVIEHRLIGNSDTTLNPLAASHGEMLIRADSPIRKAAADSLAANLGTMLDEVRAAGVPAIVCTTASNESGLAPLGVDDIGALDEKQQRELKRLMTEAADAAEADNFPQAVNLLRQAVQLAPRHARVRFLLGQVLARGGQADLARTAFLAARDLDTIPWRPISLTEQAIRNTALVKGAVLCDLAEIFRKQSTDGATGWDLLDDHVHLSLSGQALAARAMVGAMVNLTGPLQLGPDELALVQDDGAYAQTLGTNPYDDYRVNQTLRTLYALPLLKKTNAPVYDVFAELCRESEEEMSPSMLEAVQAWQKSGPQDAERPLTATAAGVLLREGNAEEALELYQIAARQVPQFTPAYLEYVFFALACRQKTGGEFDDADLAVATDAVAQGKFLLDHGCDKDGVAARYAGRICQLRNEWAEAIPFLLAARPKMLDKNRVAIDQALFLSYLQTGTKNEALALIDEGIRAGGQFAEVYQRLRAEAEQ